MIGDEVLDVAELDTEKDNNFLFVRHVQTQVLEVRRSQTHLTRAHLADCSPPQHRPQHLDLML
jgi:hypothetical protein